MRIRQAAKELHKELMSAAPGWIHGVAVDEDLIVVHVYTRGPLSVDKFYKGKMVQLVECNGLHRACMHSVMKVNYPGN